MATGNTNTTAKNLIIELGCMLISNAVKAILNARNVDPKTVDIKKLREQIKTAQSLFDK
jgi:hypothetical protein